MLYNKDNLFYRIMEFMGQQSAKWEQFFPIIQDHIEWFQRLLEVLIYPEDANLLKAVSKPTSVAELIIHANRSGLLEAETVEKLSALHSDLFQKSDGLIYSVRETKKKPSHTDFTALTTLFEEFIIHVRRLERDMVLEESVHDPQTGLRNKKFLMDDLKEELDRLERQGKPFCIAVVKINDFEVVKNNHTSDEVSAYIKLVADLIKLSLRSFDEAYFIGDGEYILSLKQADMTGGIAALERLKNELESKQVTVTAEDSTNTPLSMICCISQPAEGSNLPELVKNLREDLQKYDQQPEGKYEAVLQYHELSDLERYIQNR
ncbi:MAG: diguanylate cyclase [Alphaproteobacteria bacterium]|nr:diguanylate cyclase [Alphaproteobacteria bacterium]